jgi:hypothetical protein
MELQAVDHVGLVARDLDRSSYRYADIARARPPP